MGDVADRVTRKNKGMVSKLPLTISAQDGLISQDEFFNKKVASKDLSSYLLLHHGDFAYNKSYSNGYPFGTIKRLEKYPQGVVSSLYIAFKPNSRISSNFMAQYYESNNWHKEIYKCAAEGARNHGLLNVPPSDFFATNLNIPITKSEQLKIGRLLNAVDQTITLHEEKEHQLEQLKSALLQKMFADKSGYPAVRFEGFDEVWKHQKFSDIVKGLQNNTLSRSELNYECGTVKNIHYGDILTKFGEFIDASKTSLPYISDNTKADKFEKSFLKDGDIVIADTAEDDTVGKCVEIQGSEHLKISAGLHTIACRPKQQYGSKYLGYYFNSPVYHNQLHPLMQGIKVTSISKSSIQNTDVYIPQSVAEQSKIGDVLSKIDSLISLNQREVKKLSIIKQSLLQKMFI